MFVVELNFDKNQMCFFRENVRGNIYQTCNKVIDEVMYVTFVCYNVQYIL